MEVTYIMIPVVEGQEKIFNEELERLFPLAVLKYLYVGSQLLLILYINVGHYFKMGKHKEEELYSAEDDIFVFTRKKPYLKCVFLHMICAGSNCYFEGFVARNKSKLAEDCGTSGVYQRLLREIISEDVQDQILYAFSRSFLSNPL
ncbi:MULTISPECIES: hypothetical protein [Myroides]|uniref:hypothetical protein n=1 Tax=Myroides TaxID=76831 RepID=UPI00132C7D2F|nr:MULTISPECIES: hypothetical protein [Myroides]MVX36779.1 hypothetical protein [Myroides sp. LoEW2-1]UVD79902.1 hypothetical protein NWE55_01015 [Myroides albus]